MKKSKMKATTLRTTLTVMIIVVIGLSSFGFYYVQDKLNGIAILTGQKIAATNVGGANTQTTQKLQDEIDSVKTVADKASTITTSSQNYQGQMIKDLNKYASDTGISITDYSFSQPTSAGSSGFTPIAGVGISFMTITLGNPIPFNNLMQFLRSIESNTPKMQISGINLTQGSANSVTVQPLTIATYTR